MTTRKPKPRKAAPRMRSKPTLEQRIAAIEDWADAHSAWASQKTENDNGNNDVLRDVLRRIDSIEARGHFRDASHDDPASNAFEAVGQHFQILGEVPRTPIFDWIKNPLVIESPRAPWWRRFLDHMGSA